jgi:hypothetical protein
MRWKTQIFNRTFISAVKKIEGQATTHQQKRFAYFQNTLTEMT